MKVFIVNDVRDGGDSAFAKRSEADEFIAEQFDEPDHEYSLMSMDVEVSAANVLNILSGGGYATNIKNIT